MSFHVRGVDHLRIRRSSLAGKLSEQIFPNAAPCPANKSVIDRRRRAIFGRAIAPTATAFQHMHDAADDTPIIRSFDPSHIGRQTRLDPPPLLIAQPEKVPAHHPDPPNESDPHGIRIVSPQQQNLWVLTLVGCSSSKNGCTSTSMICKAHRIRTAPV